MSKIYRDFDLLITSEGDAYYGQVLSSPGGECAEKRPLQFAFTAGRLTEVILRLENAMLRGSTRIRSGPTNVQEKTIRQFGRELFRSAIQSSPDIWMCYEKSRAVVDAKSERLRLKLRIQSPDLAQLPWEYLYDERCKEYVTFEAAPVVRYLEASRAADEPEVTGPLRILGMVADPGLRDPNGPWKKLDTDAERHRIDNGVARLQKDGEVDFQWVPGGTASDLLEMVGRGPWHVFHFIGHGGMGEGGEDDEGFIVLEDDLGKGIELPASKLVRILGGSGLRLAVLNCCESGRGSSANPLSSPGASLVTAGLSAVVAMQFPISDQAAIRLAQGFYAALAGRESVDAAVRRARVLMNVYSDVEWGIPVLYTRSKDGHIFPIAETEAAIAASEQGAGPPPATAAGPSVEGVHVPASAPSAHDESPSSGGWSDFDKFSKQAQLRAELTTTATLEDMSEQALVAFIESARSGLAPTDKKLIQRLAEAHYRLARKRRKANLKDAFVHYNAAIELDPTKAEYFGRRANVKAMLGQNDSALADVQAAIALEPESAELHWTRGLLQSLLAREADEPVHLALAVQAYTEAIRLDPEKPRYYDSRSTVHTQRGEFELAIADLTRVIELDPGNEQAYRRRGLVRERAGDAAGAAEDFGHAASHQPSIAPTNGEGGPA